MTEFATLLRDRAKELKRHLAAAIQGDAVSVHKGRVASRRLRESLPVAGERRGHAAAAYARKSFREITRALGPVRELDVALGHLEDFGGGTPRGAGPRVPRLAIERVRAHVLAERERRRERMLARLARVDLDAAMAGVERLARAAPPAGKYDARRLMARAATRASALAGAIARAGDSYHPERLHEVRIAGKKLRYALEVVDAMALAPVAADIRLLERVQERLGILHDYQILLEHVAAVADATPGGARGAAGLRTLATAYDRECRRLHAAYLKQTPALLTMAARW